MQVTFPTSSELMLIEQEFLPTLTEDDIAFQLMPIETRDTALVEWEQKDNFTGLMQIRGLDGEPPVVPGVGWKKWRMEPGAYGEWAPISETEMTMRRTPGTYNQPISLDDLVMERQTQLLGRRIDRIRWIIWTLLSTGTFTVPGVNGQVLHAGSFAIQKATAGTPWTTTATAKPLDDLRSLLLLFAGRSLTYGPGSRLIMNRITFNALIANANAADLGGKRRTGGATFNGLNDINEILIDAELPTIEIYERGYYTEGDPNPATGFVRFIPNGKVIVVGQRPNGESVGEFQMTRNANNDNFAPGPYTYVSDSLDTNKPVPRKIRIDDGFNGGPALSYPGAVVVLTAF